MSYMNSKLLMSHFVNDFDVCIGFPMGLEASVGDL